MPFRMNGVEMTSVVVNGVAMDNVYVNGVLVFTAGWDLSGASYDSIFYDFSPPVSNAGDIVFKPDGTKAVISGVGSPDRVYRFSVNTAWNLGTLSDDSNSFDISGQLTGGRGLEIDPTGTKIYVSGGYILSSGEAYVFQYNLLTAWNLATASYSGKFKKLAPTVGSADGMTYRPDGLRCYFSSSTGTPSIVEYNAGTAWDVSTIAPSGGTFTLAGTSLIGSVRFNTTGDRMFVLRHDKTVTEYKLNTPWLISSTVATPIFTYTATQLSILASGMAFKPDGTKMYLHDLGNAYQYSL